MLCAEYTVTRESSLLTVLSCLSSPSKATFTHAERNTATPHTLSHTERLSPYLSFCLFLKPPPDYEFMHQPPTHKCNQPPATHTYLGSGALINSQGSSLIV